MKPIEPMIVRDPRGEVVAVQLKYEDWLTIQKLLAPRASPGGQTDLSAFAGTVKLPGDALAYQQEVRSQWRR